MQSWRALWNRQSLRTRLIAWFLLISLIPVVWTTIISYELCKEILLTQAIRNLKALIVRQEKLISFYFDEKKLDARDFIKDRTSLEALIALGDALKHYGINSPEYIKAKDTFTPNLRYRMKALDYTNLFLMTPEGDVVFSDLSFPAIGENLVNSDQFSRLARIFERARDSQEIQMSSWVLRPDRSSLNTYISIPMINPNNKLAGVAIVELNTNAMYRFLSSFNALGTLADLILVTKLNNKLFSISPKPSTPETHSKEEIDMNSSFGQLIEQVLREKTLVATDVDYHHQQALMVGRRFENAYNWAIITKINQNELLAPIYRLQYLFWILVTLTALAVLFAASRIARKIASPILMLTEKTKTLAAGDLSQRIEVTSQDEIGRLGESFNEMAAQLHHIISHLDYLVAKRTEEYEIQNVKLEQTIKELRETRDRLIIQEKLASLGGLTAGIAHEIKNPLNFVNNFSELSLQVEEDLRQHLNHIQSSISPSEFEELQGLFDTLKLNISKIYEHGKRADSIVYNMLQHSRGMPGERVKTDVHKLLDEYITLSYHGMRARDTTFNVKIEKQYDQSLPPINLVPQEMCRVFLNLLNNAYYSVHQKKKQHSTDASYQPTVRITTEYHQNFITIKIWDNGLGISPTVFPKLFTPFFTTKPTGEGTGLGLSLSYNIVVQGHGGSLNAKSQEEEFAEFTITLPNSKT